MLRDKEVLWRENKYEVMSHSENSYRHIQKVLKEITLTDLSKLIEEAKVIPRTVGSVRNTYQHIWGYFKKKSTVEEKNKTFRLLNNFQKGNEQEELWIWLAELAKKYEQEYLLNSTLIARYLK
ncbi:MAG TPA: DUF1722 domain-containing protein [Pseudogracilibacillus sp.]|nr:DUF1722 domain-containing protein [Pseudogracilibacillus sp.]